MYIYALNGPIVYIGAFLNALEAFGLVNFSYMAVTAAVTESIFGFGTFG